MKTRILLALGIFVCASHFSTQTDAKDQKFWTELNSSAKSLVKLPDLTPIIKKLDSTVVHINVTDEPEPQASQRDPRRRSPRQMDPFQNPEEFFERFFGHPFQGPQRRAPRRSMGSGFIITKDGYIVTNNHVIENGDKIEVTINYPSEEEQQKLPAKIVGRDPATDMALIKVKPKTDLPFAPLGDSNSMQKGDWVLAMGNPFGLAHSVSVGIISAKNREISSPDRRRFDDFIQTDAAINFGNSGGPLVNLRGEVIGINTAITAQGSGIGFAIPSNLAKEILPQLKDSGSVSRGYLGVTIQDVTKEIKEALGLAKEEGVLINDIVPDGPAAKSNLKRGDVIIMINNKSTKSAKDLQKVVARIKPGKSVEARVIRDGKMKKLSLKIGKLPGAKDENGDKPADGDGKVDRLGIAVDFDPNDKVVVVADVEPGSAAYEAGIGRGDIIRSIRHKGKRYKLESTQAYKKVVDRLKKGDTVFFDLERREMKLFVAFTVPK